jgi:hypothetical protein
MKRILLTSITLAGAAWAGSPNVSVVSPAVAQRGTEVEVTLSGGRLADARTLLFDEPGIQVLGVSDAENGKFKAKLKIAPDARIGEYVFRAVSNSGIADTRLFYVTPFPVQKEAEEDKAAPYKPQSVPLGVTIYGNTPGEDQDHFEVDLKKGQRLSAEVVGVRLSTQQQYDPFMTIEKADGTVLALMDDGPYTRQDPALSVIAPEDGKYRVILREATNSGQGQCNYILHIGTYPRPVVAFPSGGQAGTELKLTMLGDAGGPFEQTVKLPAEPDARFDVIAQKDGAMAPQANFVRVSLFPNVMEGPEPNNEVAKATPANGPLPLAFNGIIGEKGDVDFFKFTAKKGESYDINSYSRATRSPIDTVVDLFDAKGNRIAGNDDQGGPDSYFRFNVGTDGDYYLSVRDQLLRGGPLFTYRIEVTPVLPKLLTYLPEMVNNSSQERRAVPVPKGNRYGTLVRVRRADIGGDTVLESKDLPAGVNLLTDKMDKSVDSVPVVFEAKPDAAPTQKTFTVLAALAEPPKDSKVLSKVEHRVEVSENGNQRSYYGVTEDTLAIAVTDEVPVTINGLQPKVPILQNGQMTLKVAVERRNDFKGPIQIQVLYGPPGIGTPGIVTIPEGQKEGGITISANGGAPTRKWKTCIIGSVDLGKGATWISTGLLDLEVAPPFVGGSLVRTYIDQGGEGTMTLKLDQKVPFDGKAKVALVGLPQGITSEEREITKDDKEVKFTLKAAPDALAGQHKTVFASFTLVRDGEPMTNTIASGGILRVDKNAAAPKVADAKK